MATKLDQKFAISIVEGVQALVYEVERLEGQVQRAEDALSSDAVETFINSLSWSPQAKEYEKTLVAGNLRNFANQILKKINIS